MERLDELYIDGWQICQDDSLFCFGTDAVLLYGFIPPKSGRVADLCSGNGAIALMLLAGQKATEVTAVELQPQACKLAEKSAALNGCKSRMNVCCGDIRKIKEILSESSFDTVCVNPPYFKKGSGLLPADKDVAIARHEICCDIDDVLAAAEYLLRENGQFYMVHRASREKEICAKIHKYNLMISEICHIFSTPSKMGELFLLRAQKTQKSTDVKYTDFTVLKEDRSLSEAYKAIYGNF